MLIFILNADRLHNLVYLCTEMMTYIANIRQVKYTFPPASLSRRISNLFINKK